MKKINFFKFRKTSLNGSREKRKEGNEALFKNIWVYILISSIILAMVIVVLIVSEEAFLKKMEIFNQIIVFLAAAWAAFANINMMKSNNTMAAAASEEIEILKRQHDYLIAPIIRFKGNPITDRLYEIKNCTSNLAIEATIFYKKMGNYYMSDKYLIESREKVSIHNHKKVTSVLDEFNSIYGGYLDTYIGFEKIFSDFFEGDNRAFIVYLDVERKIHGTTLTCLMIREPYITQSYSYDPGSPQETLFRQNSRITFIPDEQRYYIMSAAKE